MNQEKVLIPKVFPDQTLDLRFEPDNPSDQKAIRLMTQEEVPVRIGYVPKPYNDAIHFWIQKNIKFNAKIQTLFDEKQGFRPVVALTGKLPMDRKLKSFLPKMDEFIQKADLPAESGF